MRLGSRIILPLVLFVSCYLPYQTAEAKELYGVEIGTLPYGMGRAYSAVADDWLALHYNPAGLALFEGVDFQFTELNIGVNRETVRRYKQYVNLVKDGTRLSTFQALSGRHIHARLGSTSQLTIPHVAMALIYQRTVEFENQNLILPITTIRDTTDFGFAAGFGFGFGRGQNRTKLLRLGLSLRYLRRTGGVQDIVIADLINANTDEILDRFSLSGLGLGATLGAQFQLPFKGRSEYIFSFVWHDIGRTTFGKYTDVERPAPIEPNMVAGFAARFPIGGAANRREARRFGHPRSSSALTLAFDYSHLNINTDKEHFVKHLHFGMNLQLPIISLQAGFNQSSLTLGAGVDLGVVKVNGVSYGEERGSYAGQRVDRRYQISIATGFGFSKL